ncbi:hypothetical protein [Falsiroseomonas sp. CW058]|uniref:hypothetical protein n=1 Tax=Falsiroseomonas sp. CW058 TaxID=3388664 RepID=UPI003D315EE3
MRRLPLLILLLGQFALALPAGAQTAPAPAPPSQGAAAGGAGRSPGPPLDQGPRTPQADAAHRGGGVVLEGAPGAPAPAPQPTPPLPGGPRQ